MWVQTHMKTWISQTRKPNQSGAWEPGSRRSISVIVQVQTTTSCKDICRSRILDLNGDSGQKKEATWPSFPFHLDQVITSTGQFASTLRSQDSMLAKNWSLSSLQSIHPALEHTIHLLHFQQRIFHHIQWRSSWEAQWLVRLDLYLDLELIKIACSPNRQLHSMALVLAQERQGRRLSSWSPVQAHTN